jgi:hypothetical protein
MIRINYIDNYVDILYPKFHKRQVNVYLKCLKAALQRPGYRHHG